MDLVVLLKSNTPFGILIHTSKGEKSILLAKPLTLTVIAGRKLMGKIITVEKAQTHFINLQNYHILKISKSCCAIKMIWGRQNTFLFTF